MEQGGAFGHLLGGGHGGVYGLCCRRRAAPGTGPPRSAERWSSDQAAGQGGLTLGVRDVQTCHALQGARAGRAGCAEGAERAWCMSKGAGRYPCDLVEAKRPRLQPGERQLYMQTVRLRVQAFPHAHRRRRPWTPPSRIAKPASATRQDAAGQGPTAASWARMSRGMAAAEARAHTCARRGAAPRQRSRRP
jgi:hypothetical protein